MTLAQRLVAIIVAFTALLAPATAYAQTNNGGSASAELTRQGREHAARGDDALAVRRFSEAVRLDPSYGPAYLELGAARERAGDLTEAARTYDVAIEHVPNFIAAFRARASALHRLGDTERELLDLQYLAHVTEGPETLRALAARYVENKAWPAALAVFRRLGAFAAENADDALAREAMTQVRALMVLSRELDPVAGGATHYDWVRRALSSVARRRGM